MNSSHNQDALRPSFSFCITSEQKENRTSINRDHASNLVMNFHFSGQQCDLPTWDKTNSCDIEIIFSAQYLNHYFPHPAENYFYNLVGFDEVDTCCNRQLVLHEILNCRLEGVFKQMFLESKALSLLLSFQSMLQSEKHDCENCKFLTNKPLEKNKLFKAKEILIDLLTDPPTIPELSLKIGMNQCYLKKGFKELFGSTIHEFVQQQRMVRAKMLLTSTDYSVAEVADKMGFSSTSNFSAAFKKHVGIMPSMLQRGLAVLIFSLLW